MTPALRPNERIPAFAQLDFGITVDQCLLCVSHSPLPVEEVVMPFGDYKRYRSIERGPARKVPGYFRPGSPEGHTGCRAMSFGLLFTVLKSFQGIFEKTKTIRRVLPTTRTHLLFVSVNLRSLLSLYTNRSHSCLRLCWPG